MGGKTATSTQQVQVPPQVLSQYESVNSQAQGTATTPFQQYNTTGNAVAPDYSASNAGQFVAGINGEQVAGIGATNTAAGEAQPYYQAAGSTLGNAQANVNPTNQAATGLAAASAEQVNPTDLNSAAINQYMSPYLQDVAGSEAALLNQNNQQQQAGQLGNAITSGAFGSDRTGIAAANLEQQQNLANANIYSNILNTGYNNALSTAQQQQGVGLSAAQANRTALGNAATTLSNVGQTAYGEGANTASELGSLGTGAQTAGLNGAQAQIAAGTVEQQTQQAQDTAQYNQFLQQQSYPFQVDQFLASIAEGTGALSGSTTTTQQPGGFFSDERLKEDMEPIGKTFDGQPIYRYKMKGDDRDRIGLSAQKVEKKHPDAVGLAGGFRYVDYGKATDEAANRGHFYEGGVVPMRRAYAVGGSPGDEGGLGAVLQAQQQMYGNHGQQQRNISTGGGGSHQLTVASGTPAPPPSGSSNVQQAVGLGKDAYQGYKWATAPSGPSASSVNGIQGSSADYVNSNLAAQPITPDYSAGLSGNSAAAAPGADAAGAGAADAAGSGAAGAGAADAAGAGAAEAGAGAAAGAGAGAAAGAAGAAAGAGAADAATAIAAEYAAADVAAAAIIAAKRGGAIKRRGYDSGGTPYSDPNDQIDIPIDAQTNAHVQTAGPLQKQPTGLQTAMKLGDPNQASGIAGSMFSNEALARGGVAGRRGYDDGGAPTEDSDPGDVVTPDSTAAPVTSDGSAGVAGNSKHAWWDEIKKHATAENVVPILTGLAAMGTAKTRSPGVALAAGLGAGSQSYLDTRKSLADTANEQAKTQGVDIANQLAAMKNQMAKSYLNPPPVPRTQQVPATTSQAPAPTSDLSPTAAAVAAQKVDDYYRNKYYVPPVLPEEASDMERARGAAIALSSDQPVQDAQWKIDKRVASHTAANRNDAQANADRLYAVATDSGADPKTRQEALTSYNALRQWTGDETKVQGGVIKNSRTNLPEIGAIALQGFTPEQQSAVMTRAQELVDVPNDNGTHTQMPAWKAHHAPSPEAYAQMLMLNSTAPSVPAATAAPAATTAPSRQRGSSKPNQTAPAVVSGTTQSPIALEQQRMNLAALEHVREAGDQAPNNRNINQQLLQLSAATATGPATAAVQKLSAALGLPSGSRYQEINAYLDRQAATQASAMGVPHTNAGLAASQTATGTTEYTPQALQEKVKYADALNSGTMAYREGLDKAVGTSGTPNLQKYQAFRSAWAKNFDPDIYRVEDAQRREDGAELDSIKKRLGSRGMKALAQKSANLRLLENGQIPQ